MNKIKAAIIGYTAWGIAKIYDAFDQTPKMPDSQQKYCCKWGWTL